MDSSFQCPNCAGPLDYNGHGLSVRCPYCGSLVVVPEALHPQADAPLDEVNSPAELIIVQAPSAVHETAPAAAARRSAWLPVAGLVVIVLVGLLVMNVPAMRQALGLATATIQPTATLIPSPTPFARAGLTFGNTGSGAGYFKDPRSIAVDAKGRILVGDYLPGRIQAFSAAGAFLWQHILPGTTDYVHGLAADLNGHLYAVVGRNIEVYDLETGNSLAVWEPGPQQIGYYQAITVTPRGEVLAVMERELVKLDGQGHILLQVGGLQEDFIKLVAGKDASFNLTGIAADGTGHIYISTSEGFLLKLDANGRLIDRLGGAAGSGSIQAVAVDGQGRLAWAYDDRVVITDSDGKGVGDFKTGNLGDMEFNLSGQLVGLQAASPQVAVYTLGN